MKITSLRASNFKGRSFVHQMSPITVFHGPNSSGKSARMEALQLALAGFVPGVPATPGGIYQAFGGQGDLAAGVILQGIDPPNQPGLLLGGVIRSFRPKGKSVVREDRWDKLPTDWAVAPVAVDATEYLQTSEAERTRILFRLAKLSMPVSAETVTAEMKNIKVEVNTEATQKFIRDLCDQVDVTYGSIASNGQTVQEWIIGLGQFLKLKLKSAKDNVARMTLTVQGITDLRAAQPPSAGTIQDVERRLASARTEETKLTTELGRIEADLNAAAKTQGNTDRIKEQLAGPLADCTALRDEAKSKLEAVKAKHGSKPDVEAIKQRQRQVVADGKRIRAEIDELELQIDRENREHSLRMGQQLCPYCKSELPGWKDAIAAEHVVKVHNLTVQRDGKKDRKAPLEKEFKELEQRLSAADQQRIVWDAQVNQIEMWQSQVNDRTTALARRGDALAQLAESKTVDTTDLQNRHREIVLQLQGVCAARAALDADRLRLSAERTEALQKIQAGESAQARLNEVAILKQAVPIIETLCEQLVNDSIKPLIDKVNDLCGVIMPAPLEYVDGEIGWRENGVWISKAKQLGGGRGALLFAALSIALCEPGGIILLDEWGRFDDTNQVKILDHFDRLITAAAVGQVVLAGPDAGALAGWKGQNEAVFIKVA